MTCDEFCLNNQSLPFKSPWEPSGESVGLMLPDTSPHYCTRLHVPRRHLDFPYAVEPVVLDDSTSHPHHVLVLLTAPRPQETLTGTVAALQLAGSDLWDGSKILIADGPVNGAPPGWFLASSPRPKGSAVAFVETLRIALANDPKLERLTFLEDDIALCRGALEHMDRVVIPPDVAFVTWFTYDYNFAYQPPPPQQPHPSSFKQASLAVRSTRYFILTQACTFTRATVDRLLRCPHITSGWPKVDSHDEMIGWALGDALYAAHFPVLVQHTGGLNSAVLLSRGKTVVEAGDPQADARMSPYFVGIDFDARLLQRK